MKSFKDLFQKKSVIKVDYLEEETRGGIQKSYIPKFLYKPPFGYPRYADISYIRWLASTPYAEMAISTVIDELASIEWDIILNPILEEEEDDPAERQSIKNFFNNPNTNPESFEETFIRMPVRDLLEINTGLLVKVFNLKGDMVEVIARDGGTFLKNPDIHGMFTDRKDLIIPKNIVDNFSEAVSFPMQNIFNPTVREQAAYYQYGWVSGPIPVPYGKKEIVWMERMKRTDDHYGKSPIQILANTLQWLVWAIESDIDYFNENNVPKGIIGLDNSDTDELQAFKEQWNAQQQKKDQFGNMRKQLHKVPIVNRIPQFTRIEFSSTEMQLIEKQKWYSKLVWASFGVTPTELGFTEEASGQGNQIVQSKVFRKKAINPILRLMETKYNSQIVSQWDFTAEITTEKGSTYEIPKYLLKFKVFDVDEERGKYELYDLQVKSGIKTINEIRRAEGLEEIDWGDLPPKDWQQSESSFSFGGMGVGDDWQDRQNQATDTRGMEEKSKKKTSQYLNRKSLGVDNPLILKENERPTESGRIEESLDYVLNENKKRVLEILRAEMPVQKKGIPDLVKKLGIILLFRIEDLKKIVGAVLRNNYYSGWEEGEKVFDKNFLPDQDAIKYIQDYTFENIKDMTEDIGDKLRQVLERGFMDGQGIDAISKNIDTVMNAGKVRSDTIARTETNRAFNYGKLHAMKKGAPDTKKWLKYTLDNRTSEISKVLHEKYGTPEQAIGLDDTFSVDVKVGKKVKIIEGQAPPFHPNERDSLMFTAE